MYELLSEMKAVRPGSLNRKPSTNSLAVEILQADKQDRRVEQWGKRFRPGGDILCESLHLVYKNG
jgi:hypothetical protein